MSDVGALDPLARSILAEALKLPVSDRVTLVERILRTFHKTDPAFDLEWLKEAEARLAAYHFGDLAAVDAQQSFDGLDKRT